VLPWVSFFCVCELLWVSFCNTPVLRMHLASANHEHKHHHAFMSISCYINKTSETC
jgi:hypothetical protein